MMMPKSGSDYRTFKCVNESRNAFWRITEPYSYSLSDGASWAVQVHFGKNGTKGSKKEKFFFSKHEAKLHYIKIMLGDRVLVELSPYDLNRGRITYRFR